MLKTIAFLSILLVSFAGCKGRKDLPKDEWTHGREVKQGATLKKLKPLPKYRCTEQATLATWRFDTVLAPLPDGRVMVVGGRTAGGKGWLNTTETYDPKTHKREKAKPMKHPRAMHEVLRLANGRLLAFGGMVGELELYDPTNNAWKVVGRLKKGIVRAAGVQLSDNKVFLFGGDPMGGSSLSQLSYLWDPKTRRLRPQKKVAPGLQGVALLSKDGEVLVFGRPFGVEKPQLYLVDREKKTAEPRQPKGIMEEALFALGKMVGGHEVALARAPDGALLSPPTGLRHKAVLRYFPSRKAWRTLAKLKQNHRDGAILAIGPETLVVAGGRTAEAGSIEVCTPAPTL